MKIPTTHFLAGKKLLWDGRTYDAPAQAEQARASYEKDGFETALVELEGKLLVYTRRVVRQTEEAKPN